MTLKSDLIERIRRHGPMSFSTFMDDALYDPEQGYYASGAVRTGWAGDFVTSPQIDPAFGALWATAVSACWDALDRPSELQIVEIGPGEGAFAASLLNALPNPLADVVSYRLVERVPAVRERQRSLLGSDPRTTWSESLADVPPADPGVFLANEILDNLPVDLLEVRGGALHEIRIGEQDGALIEVTGPEVPMPEGLDPAGLGDGHRIEVRPAATALVQDLSERLGRGVAVFIDYGYRRDEIPLRPGGTIVCYSRAGADDRPLDAPGTKDITAHVDWTALDRDLQGASFQVAGPYPQATLLRALGAAELDGSLQSEHDRALAEKRGADAVALLSRRHALRTLLDPGGLGRLDVLIALKNVPRPSFLRNL